MIFLHVFNIRKSKRTAKFEGLEPRRCEDIKGIVAPERDSKSFGTFEKQAPGCYDNCNIFFFSLIRTFSELPTQFTYQPKPGIVSTLYSMAGSLERCL